MNVHNVFLHGGFQENIYMKLSLEYESKGESHICKFRKSLYGLKQVLRNWFFKFPSSLLNYGFKYSKCDYFLFTLTKGKIFIALQHKGSQRKYAYDILEDTAAKPMEISTDHCQKLTSHEGKKFKNPSRN